jgi:HSP20 family protein
MLHRRHGRIRQASGRDLHEPDDHSPVGSQVRRRARRQRLVHGVSPRAGPAVRELRADLAWPGGASRGAALAPSIDVSETESELRIEADLPGVEEKDVDVTVADNILTIKGEKRAEKEETKKNFHVVERSYGSFSRSLTLPFAADPSKAKATFKNGVLSITLPKPPEVKAKAKKIAIGSP